MTVLGSNLSEIVNIKSGGTGPDEFRNELAAAHRIAARLGFVDLIHNHFSARLVDANDKFLMTPYGYWFSEVTKSSLLEIDNSGEITGRDMNPAGFIIHEAIYSARSDVKAVFHAHTKAGVAVSIMQRGLLPISQYALRFYGKVAYHDYEGATLVPGERKRLQECVRDPNVSVLVLRNHGMVTLGASVADALIKMYFLDRACGVQISLCNSGESLIEPPVEICELTARQFLGSEEEDMDKKLALEWSALKRLVADEAKDYGQ